MNLKFWKRAENIKQCATQFDRGVDPLEILRRDRDFYKSLLYDAWKSLAQQQKGMRRMARKIKRLHRELDAAKKVVS